MSTQAFLVALLTQVGDDELTLADIIDSLPTDPASIFALLLMLGFVGLVLYFGVRAGDGGKEANDGPPPSKRDAPNKHPGRKRV